MHGAHIGTIWQLRKILADMYGCFTLQVREYEEAAESAKSRSDAAAMGPTQEVLRKWFPTVTARIQREQNEVSISGPGRSIAHRFILAGRRKLQTLRHAAQGC